MYLIHKSGKVQKLVDLTEDELKKAMSHLNRKTIKTPHEENKLNLLKLEIMRRDNANN